MSASRAGAIPVMIVIPAMIAMTAVRTLPVNGPVPSGTQGFLYTIGTLGLAGDMVLLAMRVSELSDAPRNVPPPVLFGYILGSLMLVIFLVLPAIFQFVAAGCLGRMKGRGLIMTAAIISLVFGLLQTLLCGVANVMFFFANYDNMMENEIPGRIVSITIPTLAGILNLIVGGVTLSTLTDPTVDRYLNRHRSRSRHYDDYDEDRPRRGRDLRRESD